MHDVIGDGDLLDVQAGKMGHGDRDAQGAPPAASRSSERASSQYYVSWSACTENGPEPQTRVSKTAVNRDDEFPYDIAHALRLGLIEYVSGEEGPSMLEGAELRYFVRAGEVWIGLKLENEARIRVLMAGGHVVKAVPQRTI